MSFVDAAQTAGTGHLPTGAPSESAPVAPPRRIEDRFIPRQPKTLRDAELDEAEVIPLVLKFLFARGPHAGRAVANHVKLPYVIVEKILNDLRAQMLIGYRGAAIGNDYEWELTPKGMEQARQYFAHCTYYGSAPVSLADYEEGIRRQSLRNLQPKFRDMSRALDDMMLNKALISQVGQALCSGRSLFLFGPPGNGKSSIARRIMRAVGDAVWIPRTVTVGGEVIRLFDPSVHEVYPLPQNEGLTRDNDIDERWIRIRRPTIVVGGELSLRQLEATLNPVTGIIESPIHIKSNCGCLVVDDFGRQRISTTELLNRWIVPLECGHDYFSLPSGRHVQVPFEQLLVFSTNLQPAQLCDEAFLRRIGYKVQVFDPTEQQFRQLFQLRAEQANIQLEPAWLDYLIENHYRKVKRPMRFCQVDDLLGRIRDFCEFHDQPMQATPEAIEIAVNNYFSVI